MGFANKKTILLAFSIIFAAVLIAAPSLRGEPTAQASVSGQKAQTSSYKTNSVWESSYRANQRLIDHAARRQQLQAELSPEIQAEASRNQSYSRLGNLSPGKKPNILYILTDDQPDATMRTMDSTLNWFKREGKIFKNGYVATPICCPSRTEAMTGQYAHNNGVTNNSLATRFRDKFWMRDPFDQSQFRLFDDLPWKDTVQCDLYRNGYTNALFGKYVNGWENKDPLNRRGAVPTCFDKQYSWMGFNGLHQGTTSTTLKDKAEPFPGSDDYLGKKAAQFIDLQNNKNKPWFAYVSLHSPHLPLAPATRYSNWNPGSKRYRVQPNERHINLNGKPNYVKAIQSRWPGMTPERIALGQDRMVQSVDDTVQLLKNTLARTGQSRNTLVIFTSDNGYLWGDHGLYNKFYPYLDSVHVPMMMIYPKHLTPGTDRRIVSNIDVAPTIYDATGIDPMFHEVDGYSMLGSHRRDWFMIESGTDSVTPYWSAMITSRFHYIETGYDPSITGDTQGSQLPPTSVGELSYQEYYSLRDFQGQEMNNLMYSSPSRIPSLSSIQNDLRQKSWQGQGRTPTLKGCYGTIGSSSVNPCP